ncbi:MAG TPA: DUF4142 domain-containing protein [Chitinophagaceae bacterium]
MKTVSIFLCLAMITVAACNNEGKDNVEKADSINKAKDDNAMNNNTVTVDQESSEFLVRVADAGMNEVDITKLAQEKASIPEVKSLASMLWTDHSQLNQQVKQLAQERNITLPSTTSADHAKEMDDLKAKTGKNFDREFIRKMISKHNSSIDAFEKAVKDVKDSGVRTFADNTLPKLRMHRDSAQAIEKKYW